MTEALASAHPGSRIASPAPAFLRAAEGRGAPVTPWIDPGAALAFPSCTVRFRVTDEMIGRFAALTGDQSSLHVSDSFARRSAYRRPVAHGMLPVGFLALLPPFHLECARCVPVALSGRFLTPVFAGDRLSISTEAGRRASNEREVIFGYRIEQDGTHATVTSGEITVAYCSTAPVSEPIARGGAGTMLLRPVDLNSVRLEQIEKGMTDRIEFAISRQTIADFNEFLALGLEETTIGAADLNHRFSVASLLSVLLFSTSVGVCMPGATATFLEFVARFDREIDLDSVFALEGEVVHRSGGTRIVKKQMIVREADTGEIAMRGKVSTLVNPPSRQMPTVEDLKASETGWGLAGKSVIVTGASRGIGETIAKLFSVHGANVIVNYHRGGEDAGRVVREIRDAGGAAHALAADVANEADVSALVRGALEHFGAVDILVNNAARDFRPIPFEQLTWDEIQRDVDVIAKGAFLCCQQVIPHMLRQGGGKIINISSIAVDDPPADQMKYVMAKSALVGLTRSLAVELAAKNIQVNMVVPNFVETDFVAHIPEGFRKKLAHDAPMGRHASPVDVARAVVFLASSNSSFITGQKIMVTGGGAPYL